MTSRRSRLKAVTNLPVRRKALQGSADEASSIENLPYKLKSEVINFSNSQLSCDIEKNVNYIPEKEISDKESHVILNISNNLENSENCVNENANNKNSESKIVGVLDNFYDFSKNLLSSRTDSSSNSSSSSISSSSYSSSSRSSSLKSSKCFTPNVMSLSEIKKIELPIQEKTNFRTKQTLEDQNYTVINSNNNILEDGNKCYAVLTSQSITLSPLSEYTLTPLTSCENTLASNVNNEYSLHEYEEVEIYNNIESNELYIKEIDDTCESIVEAEHSESILAKISNCNGEISNVDINFETLESNVESRETGDNSLKRPSIKSKVITLKANFSGNEEFYKNINPRTRSALGLENSATSAVHVSTEVNSCRQSILSTKRKRSKCNDFTKKLADAKREFQKKYEKTKPDRSTLKMIDLIFYNPATNPMESKNKFEKKDTLLSSSNMIHDFLVEEKVDEPDAVDSNLKSNLFENDEIEEKNKMPVPQVKVGLDGEIVLDEKSIVIETTDAKNKREDLKKSIPVFEDKGCRMSYYRGKSRKSRDWADFETKRFYKALNTIGPDFSLMQKYFPKRSRLELKNKFKREERFNRNLIDKALNNPSEFDMTQLEKDLAVEKEAEEEEIEMRLCRLVKHSTKKPRIRSSLLSREMIGSDVESENRQSKSFDLNSRQLSEIEKNKKKREFDFVLQKLLLKDSEKSINKLREISSSSSNAFHHSEI